MKQFSALEHQAAQLSRGECDQKLSELRAGPKGLLPEEKEWVAKLISLVERRVDELDLTDILTRIKRLNADSLNNLLKSIYGILEGK